jgi:hypothetical protein
MMQQGTNPDKRQFYDQMDGLWQQLEVFVLEGAAAHTVERICSKPCWRWDSSSCVTFSSTWERVIRGPK